jgi:hypothetical protein
MGLSLLPDGMHIEMKMGRYAVTKAGGSTAEISEKLYLKSACAASL